MHTNSDLDRITQTSEAFKLLSDATRCRILALLMESPDGLCVYELAQELGISHSAASHQLGRLEDRGIVKSYREGQSVCYRLCRNPFTRNIKRVLHIFQS